MKSSMSPLVDIGEYPKPSLGSKPSGQCGISLAHVLAGDIVYMYV